MTKEKKIQQGRDLAGKLFDLKLTALELMTEKEQDRWRSLYPGLSKREFDDIRRQVIQAKMAQQSQIGWQVIPRDLAVIVGSLASYFINLKAGLIASVAALTLLEILFHFFYNPKLYKVLSYAVWLTYPALILLALAIQNQFAIWWQLAGILVGVWAGSFLLSMLLRVALAAIFREKKATKITKNKK